MESVGLSQKNAQLKNKIMEKDRRRRGNRLNQVHLEKWPLKRSVCGGALTRHKIYVREPKSTNV